MIKVYRVLPDVDKFQTVLVDDIGSVMKYRFDGTPIGDAWEPPKAYVQSSTDERGDFWGCFSNPSIFAVTPATAQIVVTFLDQSCETLPLDADGQKLFVCNVTCVVNCLDRQKSRHKKGIPHWIEQYVFHPNRFDNSLFKIPETRMSEVLCVVGIVAQGDDFKGTVEKHGLKGLRFKEIWSE